MRTLYFLLPGTSGKFRCGGLFAELKTMELARQLCPVELVTYRQREEGCLFLDDLVRSGPFVNGIFVVSWGFDVPKLVKRLKGQNILYHAHSASYGFRLPPNVPIVTVSRNTMGYWGQHSPNSLIYYLPNEISEAFASKGLTRDIDVLVQTRKSSDYLIKRLVPALREKYNVVAIDSFVEDLAELFNRSKVYLYDSAEYWAQQRVTEGFGLPPMEAMACGCQVFSSVNSALADYLDPGFNCHKIAGHSLRHDLDRITQVIASSQPLNLPESFIAPYRAEAILDRLSIILTEINEFFDRPKERPIPSLTTKRLLQLDLQQNLRKVRRKLKI
jgi:glycosyltransferase involved in cell wall biosynthesis